ncbi:hypothetical protein [Comamonas brasiliensis]|uniref:hypothetical protein n=1 Tax=Comamonas brasiliensis TaxID=1812482 RepID=UPI001B8C67B8|nr:hypothetical protein [Comamonas sp. PE63]
MDRVGMVAATAHGVKHHAAPVPESVTPPGCASKACEAGELPTLDQAMVLAVDMVCASLQDAINHTSLNEDWDSPDIDAEFAVEHVHEQLQRLRQSLPTDRLEFERKWLEAASIVKVVTRSFPDQNCVFINILSAVCKKFDVMLAAVEWMDAKGGANDC